MMGNSEDQSVTSKNLVLNETVVKLGLVSFFADISSEMLYPITPIFLTAVLGASLSSLGFIEGLAEAIASFLKLYSGLWSDRTERRKPFVWGGYLLSGLAKPLMGMASNWTGILALRSLDRVGKGFRGAPRDALLSDSVAPEVRGAAFGWHRGMDTLGAAVGPLLAICYLQIHGQQDLRGIYFWALIPGLCSVLIALLVKESRRTSKAKAISPRLSLTPMSKTFKKVLLIFAVFALANSSDVFLLLRAQQVGCSLVQVILFYCLYNLIYALGSPVLGAWSDRIGRKQILIGGLFVFAGVYSGFSFCQSTYEVALLFAVYGLYMAATEGVAKAWIVDLAPDELKATGLGIFAATSGFCSLFASTVTGALWDNFSSTVALGFGAGGALLAAILLIFQPTDPV